LSAYKPKAKGYGDSYAKTTTIGYDDSSSSYSGSAYDDDGGSSVYETKSTKQYPKRGNKKYGYRRKYGGNENYNSDIDSSESSYDNVIYQKNYDSSSSSSNDQSMNSYKDAYGSIYRDKQYGNSNAYDKYEPNTYRPKKYGVYGKGKKYSDDLNDKGSYGNKRMYKNKYDAYGSDDDEDDNDDEDEYKSKSDYSDSYVDKSYKSKESLKYDSSDCDDLIRKLNILEEMKGNGYDSENSYGNVGGHGKGGYGKMGYGNKGYNTPYKAARYGGIGGGNLNWSKILENIKLTTRKTYLLAYISILKCVDSNY
jgi:hypothetical protein